MNPLKQLEAHGQSLWLDYIRRSLIETGELARMIEEDGLKGLTSNPSIFQKAISGSTDYDEFLESVSDRSLDARAVYERLAVRDIRDAADVMRPVYEASDGGDGFVSLEVSPDLAYETDATCEEARRLWRAVDRPNVMIKVPATEPGLPAIERLISEGLNINITLLFAREVYERVVEAYLSGLEQLVESGGDPSRTASVASFFVSRIDAKIDEIVEKRLEGADGAEGAELRSLQGAVAIANAKLAYHRYEELFSGPRWDALKRNGARPQRLLWASTSTKDPRLRDTLYVEELVGPETVTTVPPATYDAVRDHAEIQRTLTEGIDEARATLDALAELDISLDEITDELVSEGVQMFAKSFHQLLETVEKGCGARIAGRLDRQRHSLPGDLAAKVESTLATWRAEGKSRRLWSRDVSLWTGGDEADWLGWLGLSEDQLETDPERFRRVADMVRDEDFTHILLLGMGGSSLCPEVLAWTFGQIDGFPRLHVLDSTDPAQVRSVEAAIDLTSTLFIVSSKSGTTLETDLLRRYFFARVAEELDGRDPAGRRFVAITDPGSRLQQIAEADGFRHVFFGLPSVGGRYSALSDFGMIPAAAMGLDVHELYERADEMAQACASCVPADANPGVVLGVVLGVLGREGRDKVTLHATPAIRYLGAWLEQLIAESTGKQGTALIPVDGERLGERKVYGDDRIFVYLRLADGADADQDAAVERLEAEGQPVVRIELEDRYDLAGEFFRWEFATAVAGSVLGINPFDQPDVEASKKATRKLTEAYEKTGQLPSESPLARDGDLALFADEANAAALSETLDGDDSVRGYLRAHLDRIGAGDYLALLAYIEMNDAYRDSLQRMRHAVRDARGIATCLGFGPRFLHSTGQAYKGGPNSGVFLQITCDDGDDLAVPDSSYTFGIVKAAQARGDLQVLAERERRALRVHLGPDVAAGLEALRGLVEGALG